MADLPGRDVDADDAAQPRGAPLGELPARLVDHPRADRLDQPGGLGERDELARRQQAARRVRPAHERLVPAQRAVPEALDGLVVQAQLAADEREPQVAAERDPLGGVVVVGAEGDGGGGERLRPAQREVAAAQELGRVRAVRDRETDARGGAHDRAVEVERGRHELVQALGERRLLLPVARDDEELVAVEACDERLGHPGRQPPGDPPQQLVALRVAERGVDRAEVLEAEAQREHATAPARRAAQVLLGVGAVREAGQRVRARGVQGAVALLAHRPPALDELGDVAHERGVERRPAGGDRGERELAREAGAVRAQPEDLGALAVRPAVALRQRAQHGAQRRAALGRHELGGAAPDDLRGGAPEHPLGGRAELHDRPVLVDRDDAVERGREHRGLARLGAAQHAGGRRAGDRGRLGGERTQQPQPAGGRALAVGGARGPQRAGDLAVGPGQRDEQRVAGPAAGPTAAPARRAPGRRRRGGRDEPAALDLLGPGQQRLELGDGHAVQAAPAADDGLRAQAAVLGEGDLGLAEAERLADRVAHRPDAAAPVGREVGQAGEHTGRAPVLGGGGPGGEALAELGGEGLEPRAVGLGERAAVGGRGDREPPLPVVAAAADVRLEADLRRPRRPAARSRPPARTPPPPRGRPTPACAATPPRHGTPAHAPPDPPRRRRTLRSGRLPAASRVAASRPSSRDPGTEMRSVTRVSHEAHRPLAARA